MKTKEDLQDSTMNCSNCDVNYMTKINEIRNLSLT